MNQAALTPTDSGELASLLKAAGDALRLEILCLLSSDSFGVLELSHIFEVKQSGMSHHLKVLSKAGLVSTRREGNSIFYRRSLEPLPLKLDQVRIAIYCAADRLELREVLRANLSKIYEQRAEASREFFLACADQFKQQQDLIAEFDVYGTAVAELLDKQSFDSKACALEVGPGAGEFLPELTRRFAKVSALDTSSAMLKKAQRLSEARSLGPVEFIHGDTSALQKYEASLDCVVINMVLHHTPSPGQIYADVARSMKPGASLLICDLCAHDQEWVREACGDLWLGFDPADLNAWAAEYQLKEAHSSFFALRNGFQIQIHHYLKTVR
jgi:ubiquinone/menaquinone biosynthesis C-methylase UbiE/DNA-binding transcriptional ArsR family regulator